MAENISINPALILDAHKKGSPAEKKLLEKLHPQLFVNEDYKKINSLAAALKFHGLTEADTKIVFPKKLKHLEKGRQISLHLDLIAAAIRGGKNVNFADGTTKKWFPIFIHNVPSGFGFSHSGYDSSGTLTYVGSRRSFFTKEQSDWFGQQFITLHHIELADAAPKK